MPEQLKPMTSGCIVCGREVTGLACDDPKHQEFAADEVMNANAGVPEAIPIKLIGNESFAEVFEGMMETSAMINNHLVECPPSISKLMSQDLFNGS